ncbi:MAG: Trigger factor [Parcubacteria group bacterium]|nr:Trigger factor [Parcubacteria group bacterium]
MSKHFTNIKSSSLPDSQAEITGSITVEYLNTCRAEAIKELNNKVSIPGFRSGHIPEDVLVKKLGEMSILEEAAEIALGREYSSIVEEAKVAAIGRPMIAITKLVPGTPLEFKVTTAVEPVFDLPDYKKISADAMSASEDLEVTEKEIEDVKKEIEGREINVDLAEGETVETKIKENLSKEKEFRAKEKKRLTIINELIKQTTISVPKVLVDAELQKMMGQFKDDVLRAGMQWDAYLKEIKKTEADIEADWKDKALDRAKSELIVSRIAQAEKIEPSVEELEKETAHIISHYPDADPLSARIYVYTILRNEQVFKFLEGNK